MFPQSLHKNIRELDKQITLLESECENMSTEKRKRGISGKIYLTKSLSKPQSVVCSKKCVSRENVERPFYTAPRMPENRLVNKVTKTLSTTRVCPRSSSIFAKNKKPATTRETSTTTNEEVNKIKKSCPISKNCLSQAGNKKAVVTSDSGFSKKDLNQFGDSPVNDKHYDSDSEKQVLHKGVLHANPGGTIEVTVIQKSSKTPSNFGKRHSKSAVSTRNAGVGEKSDSDSYITRDNQKLSCDQKVSSNSPKWSELLCQKKDNNFDKKNKINHLRNDNIKSSYSLGSKHMSLYDVEPKKHASVGDTHLHIPNLRLNKCSKELISEMWNDENTYPQSSGSTEPWMPRPKSPFRKRNIENVIDASPRTVGSYDEKGIQCGGDDKSFSSDASFDPLRTMCHLIEALKGNFIGEEGKKLLNQLESSLIRLTDVSSAKTCRREKTEHAYEVRKGENEYVKNLQRHFLSIKKLCDQLTKEKKKLTEDLAVKEQLLATSNEKEKEYLSAITNLKVNLEKKRVLADENLETLKELNVVKNKLLNEAKVAEALRKSHSKMQEQIHKCMLENDKLKTEIRLNKLESQKFCVLLAGKDAEIKRYKDEVEAFQRQITNQLVALKTNKAASEVQKAMEAIMKQSQVFSVTDWDSAFSETQSEKDEKTNSKQREKLMHSSPTSTKSSVADSSWNHISSIRGDESKSADGEEAEEVFIGDLRPGCEIVAEDEPKPQSFVSCKSADDLTRLSDLGCAEFGDEGANNRLRKNIEELFEELKIKCSQKMFSIPSDSVIFEDLFNSSGITDTSEMSAG